MDQAKVLFVLLDGNWAEMGLPAIMNGVPRGERLDSAFVLAGVLLRSKTHISELVPDRPYDILVSDPCELVTVDALGAHTIGKG